MKIPRPRRGGEGRVRGLWVAGEARFVATGSEDHRLEGSPIKLATTSRSLEYRKENKDFKDELLGSQCI